jgi:hypothetical protein
MNVPTEFGNKTHCTSPQPPGAGHPPGSYTCPATGGGLYCPPNGNPGGGGGFDCTATAEILTCNSSGGTPPGNAGWTCTSFQDGSMFCHTPDCNQTPAGEITCRNGTPPLPPGGNGWTCYNEQSGLTCTSPPTGGNGGSGGGSGRGGSGGSGTGGSGGGTFGNCPQQGVKRWCDGQNFCSWGQQECVSLAGVLLWGPCVEGNPNNPPNPAPNTDCACYYPFSYAPQCCERTDCHVVGERQVPCNVPNGGLCAPCGDDSSCAPGAMCVRKLTMAYDPNSMGSINTVMQFCSHSCNADADCGDANRFACIMPPGSPTRFCVPRSGSCL